jgi:hypothetical protein
MEGSFRIIDPVTIEVSDKNYKIDNFRTVLFQNKGMNLEIDLSDSNYKEMGEKLFPHGLMPASLEEKLALLNYLIKDIGPVYDNENPEWFISTVKYNEKEDRLYFDCEEEKECQKK